MAYPALVLVTAAVAFLGGAVAGLLTLLYGGLAVTMVLRGQASRRAAAQRSASLDAIADAAADLRAGSPATLDSGTDPQVAAQVRAATEVAEQTGAPLADLLDRIEEEHRGAARAAARAAAEAAGARTTAFLLLILPIGGVALGHFVGVDAVTVLLRTPVGGACALGAALLQLAGLLWVRRIAAPRPVRDRAQRDLPLAAELLAAVLRVGVPVDHAVLAVARALPLGERLTRVGRALRLGAAPDEAWRHLADLDGAQRLITAATRSSGSGAALATTLRRIAGDLRAAEADRAEARARRAAVLLVLPLGLCFLPAFVLAGLAPVVIAVVGQLSQ
jgi:Flp pilus assembly protein TadB